MTHYRIFGPDDLRAWLDARPDLAARLGGNAAEWRIREVSDGNLNTVFLVDGRMGSLCCKQALPHVRVAPDWPMPLDRALYESRYMRATEAAVQGMAPALFAYDPEQYLLAMECLSPHEVLRTALMNDTAQPGFSRSIGQYVARTALATGVMTQPFERSAALLEAFSGNTALTRITVDLILTDPYHTCDRNPPPEPALLPLIEALRTDRGLLAAVTYFQNRFLTDKQALLHGDLHTGSIMLHGGDVRVIDGEFATLGPIGFDCGLYLGNLALHLCAVPDRANALRREIALFWEAFSSTLHAGARLRGGDVGRLLAAEDHDAFLRQHLRAILRDTAGFAGLEMIRRTMGFAQVADYTLCPSDTARTTARATALERGRALIISAARLETLDDLLPLLCGPQA